MTNVKEVWRDDDFDEMGWHDSRLYELSFPDEEFQIKFDIDYIFKWEKSSGSITGFWVSPCDLIFENVANFCVDIDFKNNTLIFISEIKRTNKRSTPNGRLVEWDYEMECDNGLIRFSSTGFKQRIRKQPILSESQDLGKPR